MLQKHATGDLGRLITQKTDDCIKKGQSVPGLVLLRLIFRKYASNRQADAVYNLIDLQKVKMVNNNLEGFQITWEMVLSGMRLPPEEGIK